MFVIDDVLIYIGEYNQLFSTAILKKKLHGYNI